MRTNTFAFAFLAALSSTALVAIACSSSDSTSNSGDDGSQGGDSSNGTGANGTGATSAQGGTKSAAGGTSSGQGAGVGAGGATSQGAGGGTSAGGSGLKLDAGGPNQDAFFANDPPPMTCDGGDVMPPMVTGTVDCPSDKNREGCPCPTAGMQAACWPGLRVDRGHGICMDGMTTCNAVGEGSSAQWGPCVGYVLPDPNATSGASACKCFSGGQWKIDNLSPCFITDQTGTMTYGATSTFIDSSMQIECPPASNPPVASSMPWSTDSLTVDCAGHFKLCYTLKAGTAATASPSDCTVSSVCVEGDYTMENTSQPFPPLPSWVTMTPAQVQCAGQFNTSGGYGEMTVEGLSVECDTVDNHVFNRVQYCPSVCNTPAGQGNPMCTNCMAGGSGSFGG